MEHLMVSSPFWVRKYSRGAVFRKVVKGDRIDAHRIAINPPGAGVGQGVGVDAGGDPVDQAGVAYRAAGRQGGAASVDFTAGEVIMVSALHVEGAARH